MKSTTIGRRPWITTTTLLLAVMLIAITAWGLLRFGSLTTTLAYLSGDRLLVDSPYKSFGTVDAGEERTIPFTLINASNHPVKVLGARSSCTCAMIDDVPLTIAPSGRVKLRVKISTESKKGDVEESVALFTDSPERAALGLWVKGHVNTPDQAPGIPE